MSGSDYVDSLRRFFYKVDSDGLAYAVENYPPDAGSIPEEDASFFEDLDIARDVLHRLYVASSTIRAKYNIEEGS
jgi:hypothetical protein